MKSLFINPKVANIYEGLSIEQIPYLKKVIKNSKTLQKRLSFSEKTFSGLGLLTAASVAKECAFDIEFDFIDENFDTIDLREILNKEYDFIAIGGNVYQMNRMLAIANRALKRQIPVVVGGMAAMTFPQLFKRKGISLILGECETLLPTYIVDLKNNNPKDQYLSSSRTGIDLSISPIPLFSTIFKYDYTLIGIQTTRGCPSRCEFCQVSNIMGSHYRHKPVNNIINEIRLIQQYWPDAFFFFYDNNLFSNRTFARELLTKMVQEGIQFKRWGTNSDVTIYQSEDLLDLCFKIGPLDYLGIGFESLSSESLKTIGNSKKVSLQKEYNTIVKKLKQKGVGVFGYFMFGFENSKEEDLYEIIDFIISNRINAQISQLVPMPGTKLFDRLQREYETKNQKISKNILRQWHILKDYLLSKCGISKIEMTKMLSDAYSQIYDDKLFLSQKPLPAPFL